MKIKNYIFPILILLVFLSACQKSEPANTPTKAIPTPAKDKGTVTGRVISSTDGKPFANFTVHLAQVYTKDGNSAFVLDTGHSPSALTDQDGYFIISDITPNDYVIVIGDPMVSYAIIPDDADNNKAKVWTIVANKILDTSTLRVDLK